MYVTVILLSGILALTVADQPVSYLLRVKVALERCRADIPAMQAVADEAATRLVKGGALWAAGQPSMVSELSGRAGGFMMIRSLGDAAPGPGDVVLYTPLVDGDPPAGLRETQALVVTFGRAVGDHPCFSNHAAECGISPTLANAIPAWVFTGELIAALTRQGKSPVIYESIGAYGGNARIAQYKNGEIAWHDDITVVPTAPGVIGNRYIDIIGAMLERIETEERGSLDRAGAWAREARAQGKRLFMYSMGHLFPDEVGKTEIGKLFKSDVWNAGFRTKAPEDTFESGDFIAHIGYQQPPDVLLRRACPAGARVVYVSVRSDRDYVKDPGAIWIDPMWNWPDACVPLENYDVPLLAASGIVNGAIAWEIYRLAML